MRRLCLAVVACATAVATSGSAQGPSSDTIKPFNGTSLAGWHTEGSAQWRAAGGELVGSATVGTRIAGARQEPPGHHPEVRVPLREL